MQSRKGSIIVITGLVIAVIIIAGLIAYKSMFGNDNYPVNDLVTTPIIKAEPELTKTDEISDIEKDLNSQSIDNLDADVLGITSEVE